MNQSRASPPAAWRVPGSSNRWMAPGTTARWFSQRKSAWAWQLKRAGTSSRAATISSVGWNDKAVLDLNRRAQAALREPPECGHVAPGAHAHAGADLHLLDPLRARPSLSPRLIPLAPRACVFRPLHAVETALHRTLIAAASARAGSLCR